jgi:hypothetical protein
MLAVLLSAVSNAKSDLALAALGTLAILYLVLRKLKNLSDTHPDDFAAILDKVGLHTMARSIWNKLAEKQSEENTYLGI